MKAKNIKEIKFKFNQHKKSRCIKLLATKFLSSAIDGKFNSTEFYEKNEFSRGTVYSSLEFLIKLKAVVLENKTKKGSFIRELDYEKLFYFTGNNHILCAAPLPFTKSIQILVSALELAFAEKGIPFEIIYKTEAKQRARLINRLSIDLALVSKISINKILKKYDDIFIIDDFGKRSWATTRYLLFSKKKYKEIEDGMKIGIDIECSDSALITKKVIGKKKVELVDKKYNELVTDLKNKKIDALIDNSDDIQLPIGFKIPIETIIDENKFFWDATTAVLIANSKNTGVTSIFKNIITHKVIKEAIERIKVYPSLIKY